MTDMASGFLSRIPKDRNCDHCYFWGGSDDDDDGLASCHRFPPVIPFSGRSTVSKYMNLEAMHSWHQPTTNIDDCCGEFKRISKEEFDECRKRQKEEIYEWKKRQNSPERGQDAQHPAEDDETSLVGDERPAEASS